MDRDALLAFVRRHKYCVQATTSVHGTPQAAVVGFAVTDEFEFLFDTLSTTRKVLNLRFNPRMSLVIGWDDEQTVQLDGLADEPQGDTLWRLKKTYLEKFPDGVERESWKDITYIRFIPTWARYSDFRPTGESWESTSL